MRAFLLAVTAFFVAPNALAQTDALPTGKLPDTARPVAYRLDMTIVPSQPRFSGHTEIDVDLKAPARSIFLHGRSLHMAKASVRIAGKETPATFTQKTPQGLAQLDFGRTLPAGRITLKFDHDGAFATGPAGLYHLEIDKQWYSWTQFESIDARSAFPSFDEPGFKTPFTVSIRTAPGLMAISNAPEAGKPVKAGKLVRHNFIATKPLPTYLIAFVVGPFASVETVVPPSPQRKEPLPLRVIGTKPNAGQLQYALDESGKIVTLLESYFDQPFPYPKLDQIGSPVMPGAMENAGADIYGDGILFLDEKAPTPNKQTFGMVVAHELSHQWFGDLVTPAWWDDLWLNESFANWMGYRIGNAWRPDLNIGVDAIKEGFDAMKLDALAAGRPIHERITKDADIDAAFDAITYGKGGHVVGMIAAYMGEEKFRDGVRLHMRRHFHGNASTEQFFGSLAEAAHDPRVLQSLRSFVDQQGVPVVTLRRTAAGFDASQQRYAYFGSNAPAQQWLVPLCVRVAIAKNCTLLEGATAKIAAPSGQGPVVPNAGGWGYYRFELDQRDWDALIAAGATLPEPEALALDDSLWASFYAGKPRVPQLVQLARVMAAHPASRIALDNAERLRGLEARGLVTPQALPAYRQMLSAIYRPMLDKLGFDPAAGINTAESPDTRQLRRDLLDIVVAACDPSVRTRLTTALDAYLAGDTKALDGQYLQTAIALATEARGSAFARTIADKALSGTDPALAEAGLAGIASSNNPEVARWFLNDFTDPRLPAQPRLMVTALFLRSPATRDIASSFMLTHFDEFSKTAGGGGIFSARMAGMFNGLCSVEQANQVDAKLRPQLADDSTLGLDRVVETIRNCARFRDAKTQEVSAALMAVH
ncbi:ERAP1-like C-terminal domain-containing protein [Sphingomonas sp. IC-56]|uniref:M1 family metallopeptidase n=1 Tax=Sphingomonas sp. IC-56 TaxID=2898529 RepID=UPI001E5D220C|nr:M1 family metallopeptidase [Sphingomonas sp. IC-56]MCD2324938.1 ERAP1-like C-terminal domain-containing protein [Sphingomonas sp. IC-56]